MPLAAINRFAWNTITEERLEGLIRSTPARLQAVIDADSILASTMVEVCKIENKACKIGAFQMGPDFSSSQSCDHLISLILSNQY